MLRYFFYQMVIPLKLPTFRELSFARRGKIHHPVKFLPVIPSGTPLPMDIVTSTLSMLDKATVPITNPFILLFLSVV
jgi:hypothetical protein